MEHIISITIAVWIFLSIPMIAVSVQGNQWKRRARWAQAEVLREYRMLGNHIGYFVEVKDVDFDHEISIVVEDETYKNSIQIGQTYNVIYARSPTRNSLNRRHDICAYFENEADTKTKQAKLVRKIMISLMIVAPIVITIVYFIIN